jgi:hypothetical protein
MACDYGKSQSVRLFDVLVLGPFLAYAGARESDLPDPIRAALVVSGATTVLYNYANHRRITALSNRGQANG